MEGVIGVKLFRVRVIHLFKLITEKLTPPMKIGATDAIRWECISALALFN